MLAAEAVSLAGIENCKTDRQDCAARDLHRERYDPAADRKSLEKLAGWCDRFSPTVGIEDNKSPETLLLDATNLAQLFGGEESLVNQVERGFNRLHLKAHIGLADNIATAWAITHYGLKNAGSRSTIIPAGDGLSSLEPLPIAALRLPDDVMQTLFRLGVEKIEGLLSLPRDQLLSRFGPLLLTRINQALGHEPEAIRAVRPSPNFTVQWLLDHPLSKRFMVEQVIDRLVRQVVQKLSVHNKGALQLRCSLECQSAENVFFEAGLFHPSDNTAHILEILSMQTERLLLPSPVNVVTVCVTRHAPLARRQRLLFEQPKSWNNSSRLVSLVDRLAGRLGRQAVVRCRLHSDAQPELAYREDSIVGSSIVGNSGVKRPTRSKRLPLGPLDRPLHFFTRPIRLQTLAIAPEGTLIRFQLRGQQHHVAWQRGPERIETGWWRKHGVRRDYYRVETAEGRRFWLFRCLRRGQWFLHGTFD